MSGPANRHIESIVASNIRQAMDEQGITAAEIANRIDGHEKTVRRWRTGETVPSLGKNLPLVAEILGHDVTWFFTDHKEIAA